jgi:hypothetical protein
MQFGLEVPYWQAKKIIRVFGIPENNIMKEDLQFVDIMLFL